MKKSVSNPIDNYPKEVQNINYRESIETWFKDGIIKSPDQTREELQFFNPTLTGYIPEGQNTVQYCIAGDSVPFECWDFLDVERNVNCTSDSVTELLHIYLSDCVKHTQDFVRNERLVFEISVYSFKKLKDKLPKKKWQFDGIFTSNLADYYGMRQILIFLAPLLNTSNGNATLFVCYMKWFHRLSGEMLLEQNGTMTNNKLKFAMQDLGIESIDKVKKLPLRYVEEYNYTIPHFINYLRGEHFIFTESFRNWEQESESLPKIPPWSEVTSYNGLRMNDFSKQKNRIIPFCSRINVRRVSLKRGLERFLEWRRQSMP